MSFRKFLIYYIVILLYLGFREIGAEYSETRELSWNIESNRIQSN